MVTDILTTLKQQFEKGAEQYANMECLISEAEIKVVRGNSVEKIDNHFVLSLISDLFQINIDENRIFEQWSDEIYKGRLVKSCEHSFEFERYNGPNSWSMYIFYWMRFGIDQYWNAQKAYRRFSNLADIANRLVLPEFGKSFPFSDDISHLSYCCSQWLSAVANLTNVGTLSCIPHPDTINCTNLGIRVIKDVFLESALSCDLLLNRLTYGNKWEAEKEIGIQREEPPQLNDTDKNIIEALGTKTLIGEELAKKAGYPFNSNFKSTLSSLRKRGILGNKSPGYFVETKYQFLIDKSD